MIDIERIAAMAQARHDVGMHVGDIYDTSCPTCNPDHYREDTAYNVAEDKRMEDALRDRYPGYLWPGTEPIEAEDDDEDRIEAEDEARREEWSEYLEWQRGMME